MALSWKIEIHHRTQTNGLSSVLLRLTENRKHHRIKVTEIPREHFNAKGGLEKANWITGKYPAHKTENLKIKNTILHVLELIEEHKTAAEVVLAYKGAPPQSFFTFGRMVAERVKVRKYNSFQQMDSALNKLERYTKGKDITFEQITVSFLKNYDAHMIGLGNNPTTRYNSFKYIRSLFYDALEEGLITHNQNPFHLFKFKTGRGKREKLTEAELATLEALDLSQRPHLERTREYFLFSYYAGGMRVSDLMLLRWRNLSGERLEYTMRKTGTHINIKCSEQARRIARGFVRLGAGPGDFVFPFLVGCEDMKGKDLDKKIQNKLTTHNVNLKRLARLAGIEKKISMHTARHTFAWHMVQKTRDIKMVQAFLGHSSVKTTEVYAGQYTAEQLDHAQTLIYQKAI